MSIDTPTPAAEEVSEFWPVDNVFLLTSIEMKRLVESW
jgi:hypothetical protein